MSPMADIVDLPSADDNFVTISRPRTVAVDFSICRLLNGNFSIVARDDGKTISLVITGAEASALATLLHGSNSAT